MSTPLRLLACAVLLAFVAPSPARAADGEPIDVKIGWEGRFRPGRWVPMFVTLAPEPAARSAVLELEVPRGGPDAMRVRLPVVVGTVETTVVVHVPLVSTDRPTVTLRDANSGKATARWPADEGADDPARWRQVLDPNVRFAGVTGAVSRLNGLRSAAGEQLSAGYLEPELLPETPIGYDLLDLLVLYRADINRIAPVQQRAIADWVLAGGILLVIPSDEPTPHEGAVAELLPCRVGPVKDFAFDAGQLAATGLKPQFASIRGFDLRPAEGAEPLSFLGNDAIAYTRRAGFGRVVVVPLDVAVLEFDAPPKAAAMLASLLGHTGLVDPLSSTTAQAFATDAVGRRHAAAAAALSHPALKPVGVWSSPPALWLVAIAFVVGPVDWVVLKLLGRRPWTLTTAAGLVGLVAAGGLYLVPSNAEPNDELRSVELIDQADGRVVARSTLASVRTRRATTFALAPDAAGWWEPASPSLDASFRESGAGSAPDPLRLDAGAAAHLFARSYASGDALVQADLRVTLGPDGSPAAVRGTVTNKSSHPMSVRIRVGNAYLEPTGAVPTRPAPAAAIGEWAALLRSPVAIVELAPGATAAVDAALRVAAPSSAETAPKAGAERLGEVDEWAAAPELAADRAWRTDVESARPGTAVIYATLNGAETLANGGPVVHRRNVVVLRALVPATVVR